MGAPWTWIVPGTLEGEREGGKYIAYHVSRSSEGRYPSLNERERRPAKEGRETRDTLQTYVVSVVNS